MARSRTIVVAGAGIGGLAAALRLARAGYRVVVCERAPRLEPLGAGIQLSPNATRALAALGVLEALRERAVQARGLVVGDGDSGGVIVQAPLAPVDSAAPWLLASRADLQDALYRPAADHPDIEFEFGAALTDVARHARGVTASIQRSRKGAEVPGVALIGADGLWSATRKQMHPASRPTSHGLVAWRALVPATRLPAPFHDPVVRLWLGRGAHLVHYPVSAGADINVVAIFSDPWQGEDWSDTVDPATLPAAFSRWAAAPRALLSGAREFRRWALFDLPTLPRWGDGAVTLLGDAAHAMLPFLAQGAAAALEDALVLGRRLEGADDATAALRAYENERMPRTARLQAAARATGAAYRLGGPLAFARNLALRALGGDYVVRRNAWIYRYDTAARPSS
jgi:salicylate hydroxylase